MARGLAHGMPFRKLAKEGPWKRLEILKSLVNALVRHERIETTFPKAHETQKYAERLIEIAKYGPSDAYCRDMMEFWTEDEQTKDKIYNNLLPRFQNHSNKFTRLALLPKELDSEEHVRRMAVLEFKGNPLPPLPPVNGKNPNSLQNILLRAAKEDWQNSKK